jgi:hypothetical protein
VRRPDTAILIVTRSTSATRARPDAGNKKGLLAQPFF